MKDVSLSGSTQYPWSAVSSSVHTSISSFSTIVMHTTGMIRPPRRRWAFWSKRRIRITLRIHWSENCAYRSTQKAQHMNHVTFQMYFSRSRSPLKQKKQRRTTNRWYHLSTVSTIDGRYLEPLRVSTNEPCNAHANRSLQFLFLLVSLVQLLRGIALIYPILP